MCRFAVAEPPVPQAFCFHQGCFPHLSLEVSSLIYSIRGDQTFAHLEPGSIKLSPMESPLLRNLEKDMFDFKFTVRIGRIWEHWSADSSTLYDLDFVIVDRKGGTTEGSVPKDKMAKFKDKFHEGVVFTIQRYQIFRARDKYTTVDHPFRISFVGEHW